MTDRNPKTANYQPPTAHFDGFTLVELMISVAILTLISTATVYSLRATRQKEELRTAARILSGDIRNVQAMALAARNVLTCDIAGGVKRVCEISNPSQAACVSECEQAPPSRYGIEYDKDGVGYTLFADIGGADWRLTSDLEIISQHQLNPLGNARVAISNIQTELGDADKATIAVGRQNGTMRIDACDDVGLPDCVPTEPQDLKITLKHQQTDETAVIEVNAITGRVSVR
jgi:prepilin-type N-terminal cleavage/methylation domain-containing protein